MTIQNDFLPFAVGAGANVLTQSAYAALAAIEGGYQAGTAQSAACNKTWRQSSIMTAVIAQFIVAQTGQPAVDDGTTAALLANFTEAVSAAARNSVVLVDTGSANTYAAANSAPLTALPTATGVAQIVSIAHTNTGASTYAPDGLPAAQIFGPSGAPLQGGELVAGGVATLLSYVGPLMNAGALCWVLLSCVGGASQLAAGSYGTTPVGSDNSNKIATTAFARSLGLVFPANGGVPLQANTALTAAQAGNWFQVQVSNITGTLPPIASVVAGSTYTFLTATSGFTLKGNGSDVINLATGAQANSYQPVQGECVTVAESGGQWYVTADSIGLLGFGASLSASGYQKLPNGLIVQWTSVSVPVQQTATFNFPITFPQTCFLAVGSIGTGIQLTSNQVGIGVQAISTSQFQVSVGTAVGTGSVGVMVIAIGK